MGNLCWKWYPCSVCVAAKRPNTYHATKGHGCPEREMSEKKGEKKPANVVDPAKKQMSEVPGKKQVNAAVRVVVDSATDHCFSLPNPLR